MDDFSTLTQVSPVLTNNKLSEALTQWFGEDMVFTSWKYVSETEEDECCLSELMKIKVFGQTSNNNIKHVQVILKSMPKNLSRKLTFRSDEFFRNEINFYKIVLPALLSFQNSKNITRPLGNFAKIFLSYCDGVNDVICLEDASLKSFGSAVRQEGIDLDLVHCKVTFDTLARFHAISYAMKDQKPEEFNLVRSSIFETYYTDELWYWYERFWKRICGIAIDAVEKEYPDSKYLEKIKEFAVPERYKEMIRAVKSTFESGVISHGDCWTYNFLYRYNETTPVEAMLIDFQLSRCASPVLDLSFIIYVCTSHELRLKHFDELMSYYYDVLANQIKELGSDPNELYSREMFMEEVKNLSYFGLAFSFEYTPFIVLAPEDAVDMEMMGEEKLNIEDVWQIKPIKTKEGRLREANNIVHCVDNGFI